MQWYKRLKQVKEFKELMDFLQKHIQEQQKLLEAETLNNYMTSTERDDGRKDVYINRIGAVRYVLALITSLEIEEEKKE